MSLQTKKNAVLLISNVTKIPRLFNMQTLIKLAVKPEMNKTFIRRNLFVSMEISAFSLLSTEIRWPFSVSTTSLPPRIKLVKTFQSFKQWRPAFQLRIQTVPRIKTNKLKIVTWMIIWKKIEISKSKSTRSIKMPDVEFENLKNRLDLFLIILIILFLLFFFWFGVF